MKITMHVGVRWVGEGKDATLEAVTALHPDSAAAEHSLHCRKEGPDDRVMVAKAQLEITT